MNVIYTKAYTTHIAMLIRTVERCRGDVLEFGAGPTSTPLLHWLCKDLGKRLVTLEHDKEYFDFAHQFRSWGHKIIHLQNGESYPVDKHWGVVFIDHNSPFSTRGAEAIRFKDSADYIVLHDTEYERTFGYGEVWKHFKYRFDWKECRPWTSIVSNFDDLSWLTKQT